MSLPQLNPVFRRLGRAPLFTAVTLITLAIGVGANTAIFSVLDGVLLKPLPYPHADDLVGVWHTAPGLNMKELAASPSIYFIYSEQNRTFQDIGLYTGDSVNVTGVGEPEQVRALLVTERVLPILGIPPLLGRWFTSKDETPGSPDTMLLSYGYWQRKFGGDPAIVGRRILVRSQAREVIGVLPPNFHFLGREDPPLILPLRFDRNKTFLGNFSYQAVARLKPGATITQANADVARMLPIVDRSFPLPAGFSLKLFEQARIGPNVRPFKQDVIGDVSTTLWVLMATIGMVLLIACANVANLLLVRAEGRQQELGIRAALGASRLQIACELLFESLLLGIAGGALGLALAYAAIRVLIAMAPTGLPRLNEIGIDTPVLLFTVAVSLLAGLLFGSIPVFKYAGARLGTGLREGGRTLSQSRERHRARSTLVIVQVALAVVLLVSSGLMIRTFRAMTHVQPGFVHPAEVQTLRISIPEAEVKEQEQVFRMQEELLRRMAAIPGVTAASIATKIPMDGNASFEPIFTEDRTYAEGQLPPIRRFHNVSPGFFGTIGAPLVAGRDFTWSDLENQAPMVLVSENLAREYWHDPSRALGKRIRVALGVARWHQIIGVVADIRDDGADKPAPSSLYWPILVKGLYNEGVEVPRTATFAIRSSRAGAESFLKEVRQAVWSVDANLPLAEIRTLDDYYRKSMARTSFTLIMLAAAGAMALLLGVVGIYGVIAYSVSQRTREIGIRVALGAQHQQLTGMFVRHGMLLTTAGVVCGLAASIALTRLMSSLLFEVSRFDPMTYGTVAIGLAAASALASYLPSRRAAAGDPIEALRAE
jgi:putative ABC transport system permease protein